MKTTAVVSQNGDVISFAEFYHISKNDKEDGFIIVSDPGKTDSKYIIGEYKEEENAIKALEMIALAIRNGENLFILPDDDEADILETSKELSGKYKRQYEEFTIISQNKEYVIKNPEHIYILLEDDNETTSIYATKFIDEYHLNIGHYSNKQIALDEMIEIMKEIDNGTMLYEVKEDVSVVVEDQEEPVEIKEENQETIEEVTEYELVD